MKVSVVLVGLLWPAVAFAQQTYTNADLEKFDVPGAYTNEDLRRLPPLAVQRQAAVNLPPFVPVVSQAQLRLQKTYDDLGSIRDSLALELDLELSRVEFSRSPFAGNPNSLFEPRLGYGAKVYTLILELEKRIAILDAEMEDLLDQARRDGFLIETR
ncbi:MAG TPA: hypothetical protein VKF61_06580 [Candidatus Polarisedimenticolia bacterium]|nr:hypothetical protein [Candidatus Polarisedimenticolia bacterium]